MKLTENTTEQLTRLNVININMMSISIRYKYPNNKIEKLLFIITNRKIFLKPITFGIFNLL